MMGAEQVKWLRLMHGQRGKWIAVFFAVGVAGALIGSSWYGWHLPILPIQWRVLLPGLAIAVLIFAFLQEGTIEPIEARRYKRGKVRTASEAGRVPPRYQLTLLCRVWLFPVFLTCYLLFLLVEQTQVFALDQSIWYILVNKQLLLVATVVSGLVMLFGEQFDEQFEHKKKSVRSGMALWCLSIVLSMVWGFIILQQVLSLGTIGIVIANIVIVLLYLVGVLLVQDEEE